MQYTGGINRDASMKMKIETLPEPLTAPCGVLVDALWNRVAEPLRGILDDVAQNVEQGTAKIDIPEQQAK